MSAQFVRFAVGNPLSQISNSIGMEPLLTCESFDTAPQVRVSKSRHASMPHALGIGNKLDRIASGFQAIQQGCRFTSWDSLALPSEVRREFANNIPSLPGFVKLNSGHGKGHLPLTWFLAMGSPEASPPKCILGRLSKGQG